MARQSVQGRSASALVDLETVQRAPVAGGNVTTAATATSGNEGTGLTTTSTSGGAATANTGTGNAPTQ